MATKNDSIGFNANRTAEYVSAVVAVLELMRKRGDISRETGKGLAGGNWRAVADELAARRLVAVDVDGSVTLLRKDFIDAAILSYQEELRRIHQAEQDRLLDNKSKAAAIDAARWAKAAASISLLSMILSMLQ